VQPSLLDAGIRVRVRVARKMVIGGPRSTKRCGLSVANR